MIKYEIESTIENLRNTIEKNVLGRNSQLIVLAKMISQLDENVIISIDGKWGSGKTFFVKQFMHLIENIDDFKTGTIDSDAKAIFDELKDKNLVIYYNAWENDMHTKPLESIMYNILNEYPKQKQQLVDFNEFKKLIKPFCRDALYSLSNGFLDMNNLDKMNTFEDLAAEIFTIEEKKNAFKKLIDAILGERQRLILVIDELDRCKPTFAVEMLETIKHFYSNPNITVIVSTNNLELSNTIRKFYGNDFDGYSYLSKIYDFTINLEIKDIKPYLKYQLDFCRKSYIFHDFSYLVMDYFNFSLRDCNKFMTMYNMLKNYIEVDPLIEKDRQYIFSCIILPISFALKIKNGSKYTLFISNKGEEIIKNFLVAMVSGTHYEGWIKDIIKNAKDDYIEKIIEVYHSLFNDDNNGFHRLPFFEAISMLGTNLLTRKEDWQDER